jgi:hypothetical protein
MGLEAVVVEDMAGKIYSQQIYMNLVIEVIG